MTQPAYIDLKTIAERIGISYNTLRTWRRRGVFSLPAFNPAGTRKVMFKTSEVDAWWSAQRRPA